MQCSRNQSTKTLYSRKMTPSISSSIHFLKIPNILLSLFPATEHREDYFRKLTDHFSELRLLVPSSALHRHGLDYFCYMCCLSSVLQLMCQCFCPHVPFSEIFYFLQLIWHLTTWNALIICIKAFF